jgi:Fe2+ transport system protein B
LAAMDASYFLPGANLVPFHTSNSQPQRQPQQHKSNGDDDDEDAIDYKQLFEQQLAKLRDETQRWAALLLANDQSHTANNMDKPTTTTTTTTAASTTTTSDDCTLAEVEQRAAIAMLEARVVQWQLATALCGVAPIAMLCYRHIAFR